MVCILWNLGEFLIFFVLITIWLKGQGYLPNVNKSHIHDVAKWMFAISFLWTYLWFSQFMLIWYSNIPEEVTYYITRIGHFKWLFFGIFFTNFLFPMVILIARDAKRTIGYVIVVGCIIFIRSLVRRLHVDYTRKFRTPTHWIN